MVGTRRAAVVSIVSGWLAASMACSPSETIDASLPDAPEPPCAPPTDSVDLLFMVDTSGSMAAEQALLRASVGRLVRSLVTGNRDDDEEPEVPPARSIRIGVVSSNMGAGDVPAGESVPSCNPGLGDDGILQTGRSLRPGCREDLPLILHFDAGADDVDSFATDAACVLDLGTGGCGFEQQLDAVLKALSPALPTDFVSSDYVPPTFWRESVGHAGPGAANEGFLRADSALGIVLLTDEEDCSVPEYDIFYMYSPDYMGNPLNLRCHRFPGAQYPIERYVDGFLQLRTYPSRLVYAPIAGIPVDLSGMSPEDVLADPRMENVEDTSATPPVRLLPSCDTANGTAFAPRRMMEVATGIEEGGGRITLQSLCSDQYDDAIDAIVAQLDLARAGTCE